MSSWPAAAGGAGIKHETVLAAPHQGFNINAAVEVAPVGWICIDAVLTKESVFLWLYKDLVVSGWVLSAIKMSNSRCQCCLLFPALSMQ